MRVIEYGFGQNNTQPHIAMCPNCDSIFEYFNYELIYGSPYTHLNCPACGMLLTLSMKLIK